MTTAMKIIGSFNVTEQVIEFLQWLNLTILEQN